jgi:hypothetical protein
LGFTHLKAENQKASTSGGGGTYSEAQRFTVVTERVFMAKSNPLTASRRSSPKGRAFINYYRKQKFTPYFHQEEPCLNFVQTRLFF